LELQIYGKIGRFKSGDITEVASKAFANLPKAQVRRIPRIMRIPTKIYMEHIIFVLNC